MKPLYTGFCFVSLIALVLGQGTPPSTWPQVYPGQPKGPLSPAWQDYYLVDESQLTNITFPLSRSFAGNIPINRVGHPNDTFFFWAFEKERGSLTVHSSDEPWLIWLNGGPGSSSMIGLTLENGPIRLQNDLSFKPNNYSWDRLADAIWVDQPVGTGFSTSDSTGYVLDSDQMGTDFVQFLSNIVKVFPSLATRPLYLTGESYAGRWIPYITKTIFETEKPPVKLAKIAIGDGVIPNISIWEDACAVNVIKTFPQLVDYDTEVLDYFVEQQHLCGYDLNLTYPQHGLFPTVAAPSATDPNSPYFFSGNSTPGSPKSSGEAKQKSLLRYLRSYDEITSEKRKRRFNPAEMQRERRRDIWKRNLVGRSNGTIDSWYACNLYDEIIDYASNFSFPWTTGPYESAFDVYEVPDALNPKPATSPAVTEPGGFFNDPHTRAALHAPTSKDWHDSFNYPFNNSYVPNGTPYGDISADPITFFTDLAKNASERNVGIVIYSGNWDSLVAHHGSEIAIQNTTFGGVQGFSRKPSTPWYNDDGSFAGIVHQERGFTYVLFQGASHLVPQLVPAAAHVFLREFVLGNNKTGLVEEHNGHITVVGGENSTFSADYIPGGPDIYYGSYSTQGTASYPSATVEAWDKHLESATAAHVKPTGV